MAKHIQTLLHAAHQRNLTGTDSDSFTSKSLARRIGVAPSTLSKLRTYDSRWPQLPTAVALADALGVTPEEVFEAVRKDLGGGPRC